MDKLTVHIKEASEKFLSSLENDVFIKIITHLDTDGISSAAIFSKMLYRLDQKFSLTIVKQLEKDVIDNIINEVNANSAKSFVVFLDLGSGSLSQIKNINSNVLIIDHHYLEENYEELGENIIFINQRIYSEEQISASGLTYLFAKAVDDRNKDLSDLSILGLVGDLLDKEINKIKYNILKDATNSNTIIKKGLPLFASNRPIHKSLELSSTVYIPGVTGSSEGALDLLKEAGIDIKYNNKFKTILDLTKEELSRLITAIILRRADKKDSEDIISNIFLIKFFGKQEDARELSSLINACGRLGYGAIAVAFCLGDKKAMVKAEEIYNSYRYKIVKSLNWVNNNEKFEGDGYVIINAKEEIPDTIIGTITSIIASSFVYPTGTIIVGLAYREDGKIKVSSRVSGNVKKINLKEFLSEIAIMVDAEVGGHDNAAGCLVNPDKEGLFLELLEKELKLYGMTIKI